MHQMIVYSMLSSVWASKQKVPEMVSGLEPFEVCVRWSHLKKDPFGAWARGVCCIGEEHSTQHQHQKHSEHCSQTCQQPLSRPSQVDEVELGGERDEGENQNTHQITQSCLMSSADMIFHLSA
jgi:hypothetical protein